MNLTIKQVIINKINKTQGGDPTTFIPEPILDSSNEKLVAVIQSLDDAFNKKTEKRAKFSDDGFKKSVHFLSESNFYDFTAEQTERLKDLVSGTTATGGYIIFCLCKRKHEFISVFIVRDTSSTQLQIQDDNWDIDTVTHLDTKNFAMGCRVNISVYQNKPEERPLSFIRGNTDISNYFENWVGITEEKSESKDVNSLIYIIENIDLPEGFDDTAELKQGIYNYVKSSGKNRINVRELSNHFYGDEQKIADFARDNDIDLDGEFKISSGQLSKFYKVSAKVDGVMLQAPLEKISADASSIVQIQDGTIIIRSEEMVADIQRQLGKHNEI